MRVGAPPSTPFSHERTVRDTARRAAFRSSRHAGPAGDVAEICRAAEAEAAGLKTVMTPLVAEHPLLVDILADRWSAAGRDR